MKKLHSKKTKQKTLKSNEKPETKIYVSDMGIGFRVLDFRV